MARQLSPSSIVIFKAAFNGPRLKFPLSLGFSLGIFLEWEVSLMASWFAAEMRTEFCERPDHIAEPSKHTAAYGSKLNGPHSRLCFDHGGNPGIFRRIWSWKRRRVSSRNGAAKDAVSLIS